MGNEEITWKSIKTDKTVTAKYAEANPDKVYDASFKSVKVEEVEPKNIVIGNGIVSKKLMKKRFIWKSADTGLIVSEEFAKENPKTCYKHAILE